MVPRRVARFLAANVLFGSGLFFHAFLYNFYLDRLGLPPTVMGRAAAALTAGGLLLLVPAGWFVDRVGARAGLLVAAVVCGIGLAAGALTTAPWAIYAAAATAGAGNAFWRVTQAPTLIRLASPTQRARVFSLNVAVIIGAGAVGVAIAGATPGWLERVLHVDPLTALRLGLGVGAVASLASLALYAPLTLSEPEVVALNDETAHTPVAVPPAAHRRVLVAVALVGAWMIGPALGAPFFNLYFNKTFTLPVDRVGLLFALGNGTWALAVAASGELTTRLGIRRMLPFWLLLFGPVMLTFPLAGTTFAVALFLLQGMAQPCANPLIDQVLMERSAPHRRGSVSSWRNVAADASAIAGASAGGWLVEHRSFSALFLAAGAWGIVVAIPVALSLLALRKVQDDPARAIGTTTTAG